jgi:hypothetical protein
MKVFIPATFTFCAAKITSFFIRPKKPEKNDSNEILLRKKKLQQTRRRSLRGIGDTAGKPRNTGASQRVAPTVNTLFYLIFV